MQQQTQQKWITKF